MALRWSGTLLWFGIPPARGGNKPPPIWTHMRRAEKTNLEKPFWLLLVTWAQMRGKNERSRPSPKQLGCLEVAWNMRWGRGPTPFRGVVRHMEEVNIVLCKTSSSSHHLRVSPVKLGVWYLYMVKWDHVLCPVLKDQVNCCCWEMGTCVVLPVEEKVGKEKKVSFI